MIQRFLSLDTVPELRSEPGDQEKPVPEVEVLLPIEVYWQAQEVIRKLRYAKSAGFSTAPHWHELARLVHRYILLERDRVWFTRHVGV